MPTFSGIQDVLNEKTLHLLGSGNDFGSRGGLHPVSGTHSVYGDSLCKPNKNLGRNVNNVNSHLYSLNDSINKCPPICPPKL